MKVIIPVVENKNTSHLTVDEFRNASKACIYDCATKTRDLVSIDQLIKNAGNLTVELKAKGIHTVISPNMSFFSLSLFLDSELKVFKAKGLNLEDNIQLYVENQLEPYNRYAGFGVPGCSPSACSSCASDCN
ncbi:hypothetical protein R9C00_08915 [Flammeovirgaceae bacterium SG7u.111]|nr:hypothetical protein [Flammeovirgaceae bacterium SG7u.132]WPO37569.1 hypothetical protein R9C00_08915 [Flammeovirgaceae bacterium SG7u.111]